MYPFHSPTTICVSGPTSCGKTTWILKLIKHKDVMFDQPVERVVYFYGIWQEAFNEMDGVEFIKDLPQSFQEFGGPGMTLCLIDDLLIDCVDSKAVELLFTRESHHLNITALMSSQNCFRGGRCARTIALNTHTMVLFKNVRSALQIRFLGRDIFTGNGATLTDAYEDAVSTPFNPLVLDLSPHCPDGERMRTNVFPGEQTYIYQPVL